MEPERASRPEVGGDPTLRQRLIKRIALAALAVGVLLGGLAVIDRYYVPPPTTPPRSMTASLTPPPAPAAQEEASPVAASAPAAESVPEKSEAPPITQPAVQSPKPRPTRSKPMEASAEHIVPAPAPRHAAVPKPLAREPRGPRQFVLQMGVFGDVDNAKNLNEKLKQAGVPSRIEAKVQVGPFKSREEAEAARKKLIELGLSPGTLLPVRK
jgi:DedD protein